MYVHMKLEDKANNLYRPNTIPPELSLEAQFRRLYDALFHNYTPKSGQATWLETSFGGICRVWPSAQVGLTALHPYLTLYLPSEPTQYDDGQYSACCNSIA